MRRTSALPVALAAAFLACSDPMGQPEQETTAGAAAVVPGERWEVLAIASGNFNAAARDINDAGVIVGTISNGFSRAFRWSAGAITTYPATEETWMKATGINSNGLIVGSTLRNDTVRGYVRLADGTVVLLPYYGQNGAENYAVDINDAGEIAGYTSDYRGFRWSVSIGGWTVKPMPTLLNKPVITVYDINNAGWIVGSAKPALGSAESEAFVQRPGGSVQLLGSFGGPSKANVINNSGTVFGGSDLANGVSRAFTWTSFGGMKDAGSLAHWSTYVAFSDKGRIVGTLPGPRTFTTYKGSYAVLPLPPNGVYSHVYAVNTCGVIVGRVRMNNDSWLAVRWRRVVGNPPVPICD